MRGRRLDLDLAGRHGGCLPPAEEDRTNRRNHDLRLSGLEIGQRPLADRPRETQAIRTFLNEGPGVGTGVLPRRPLREPEDSGRRGRLEEVGGHAILAERNREPQKCRVGRLDRDDQIADLAHLGRPADLEGRTVGPTREDPGASGPGGQQQEKDE